MDITIDFLNCKSESILEFHLDENGDVVKVEKDPVTLSIEQGSNVLNNELNKLNTRIEFIKVRFRTRVEFIPIIVKNNCRKIRLKIVTECE